MHIWSSILLDSKIMGGDRVDEIVCELLGYKF